MRLPTIEMSTMYEHDYSDAEIKSLKMRGTVILSLGVLFLFFLMSTFGNNIISSLFLLLVVTLLILWGLFILGDKKLPNFMWPQPLSEKSTLDKHSYQLFPDGRRLSDVDIDDLDTERPIHEILSS